MLCTVVLELVMPLSRFSSHQREAEDGLWDLLLPSSSLWRSRLSGFRVFLCGCVDGRKNRVDKKAFEMKGETETAVEMR